MRRKICESGIGREAIRIKTEDWNGYKIRFVEMNGEWKMILCDFLSILEELTSGRYLDISSAYAKHKITSLPLSPLFELEDGRLLIKREWFEISDIDVEYPIPVFVDIEKAYGIRSYSEFHEFISKYIERPEEKEEIKGIKGVYVVKAENIKIFKIGMSNKIEERFAQLKTMSPDRLSMVGIIKTENPFEIEKRIHEEFQEKRHHGEWFCLEEKDLDYMEEKFGLDLSVSEEVYRLAIN